MSLHIISSYRDSECVSNFHSEPTPPGTEGHPRLASFHELASVNKLAGVLNASLSFVLLT